MNNRDNPDDGSLRNPSPPPLGWPDPMGDEAFYGLAGSIVKTLEPSTEADPAAVLLQLMAAFGNVIGRGPYVPVEADRHASNLFIALVGPTGKARKGTSWGYVDRMLREVDPIWARERMQGGLSSGEGVINAVQDGTTSEPGMADRRLFVFESELGGTLRAMARPTNTLSAVLRQAWDGKDLRVLTRRSPLKASGAHISIVGQTTPDDLADHLARGDIFNGFANRFIWACVRRSKFLPLGGRAPGKELQRLTRSLGASVDFARRVTEVGFSKNAGNLWREKYADLSADVPGLLGAVTSKLRS